MDTKFPGESVEYRTARDRLLELEIDERRLMTRVAAARRDLPAGGVVPDYVFSGLGPDGAPTDVRLSELFAPGKDSLLIYNFMFPRHAGDERPVPADSVAARWPLDQAPCPSCTGLLDQLDGAARHLTPLVNFAVVAKAPLDRIVDFARERGWRFLRMLSSEGNNYKRDYHGETEDGQQTTMMNVFHRHGDTIRHFWSSELIFEPSDEGQDPRHLGTIEPLWTLLDFTKEGRPADWDEQLGYETRT